LQDRFYLLGGFGYRVASLLIALALIVVAATEEATACGSEAEHSSRTESQETYDSSKYHGGLLMIGCLAPGK